MVVMNDTQHICDAVFFEGTDVRQRLSRFWILITLASIIAAAGVAADSTATVIGAMIVAPLMTPILGTMLSVVLADRTNLIRSLLHVAGGALVAVAIAAMIVAVSIPFGRDVYLRRPRHDPRSPHAGGCAFVRQRGRLEHGQRHHPRRRGPRPHGGSASFAQYRPASDGARGARRRSHGGARRARSCEARHLRLTGYHQLPPHNAQTRRARVRLMR